MKYLYYCIGLSFFWSCSTIELVDVDFNSNILKGNYNFIDTDYEVLTYKNLFEDNDKISVLYFFDPQCPACWFKYEDMCKIMTKYENLLNIYVFMYNADSEFISKKKFKNYNIDIPIFLIDKKPFNLSKDILYFTNNITTCSFLEQRLTKKDIYFVIDKLK
ncbi:MAG: hypothetical protein IZT56_06395 [Bacteroidetes bacterium]|nr:hypothetical protein [Bacteroidota bacterium]